ncbi:nuclear transport factor 2 family protein [Sneathiella chinensis]|uniref:SnoaL-like domain-containing protein n=1 Tax=Sneathiella chinensis TaxID=349750 RepID=A0ABQ5U4R6_9PROT|nr:nuclear transport factor 2 family protein [Sneathiella chinensis]GLQ05471.1 hypothetical protein GCM10007924_06920 [Sneathiella chinensis]
MSNTTYEKTVDCLLSRVINGDTYQLPEMFTNDSEIHVCLGNQLNSDSFSATYIGEKGTLNFLKMCRQMFDFTHITPAEYHLEGHKLIVRGDLECSLIANGQGWVSGWMQIWTFDKDKISKIRMFADYTAVPRQPNIKLDYAGIRATAN